MDIERVRILGMRAEGGGRGSDGSLVLIGSWMMGSQDG
jgi:hypothetical protein